MFDFKALKQRLAVSLAQRMGLCEMQELLLSLEEKLDWIMEKMPSCPNMDMEELEKKIQMKADVSSLNVGFITDEKYIDMALMAIWTLYEHQMRPYNVKLVMYRCQEKEAERVRHLFPNVTIVKVDECNLPFKSDNHVTEATMLKLMLPELFPELEKLLLIDCDTLIQADLHELDNILQKTDPLAAVRDAGVILSSYFKKTILPITHSEDYINAGVLLMNLDYFRKNDCMAKIVELAHQYPCMPYAEQDLLNILFAGRMQLLPPRFNVMKKLSSDGLLSDLQLARIHQMSLGEFQAQEPAIFHISGPNKPWNTTRAFKYPLWREEAAQFRAYCKGKHIDARGGETH